MAEVIFFELIRITFIGSVGILLLLMLKKFILKKYTKQFNYYIWLVIIIRMLIPFNIPITLTMDKEPGMIINNVIEDRSGINETQDYEYPLGSLQSDFQDNNIENGSKISYFDKKIKNIVALLMSKHKLTTMLVYLWLCVALIISIYRIISYRKMKNLILDLSYSMDENNCYIKYRCNKMLSKIKCDLMKELKLKQNITLKISDAANIPFGMGILKKYIIIPANSNLKEDELRWILKHELIHYKKRDLLYKYIVIVVKTIYWFNPLVYIMSRTIENECELSCDEDVLKNHDFNERKEYALTLVKSLKDNNQRVLGINLSTGFGDKKLLKERFEEMFSKKAKSGILIAGLCIVICIASFFIISNRNLEETSADDGRSNSNVSVDSSNDEIELYQLTTDKYKGYYMEIKDPKRIKVGVTVKLNEEGQTASKIAQNYNAVAAINGGGFLDQSSTGYWNGTGGIPVGIIMSKGEVIYNDVEETEKTELFAIDKQGQMIVGTYSVEDLKEKGVQEAVSFGPSLIIDGKMSEMTGDGGWGIAPRTAIGQKEDGTIILLVIDGRGIGSLGATLKETQEIMYKLGAVNAINLDGGKSSTMYYNGNTINETEGRKIPTAILVQ